MKKIFFSFISLLLCVLMIFSTLSVAASTDDQAKILSTEMNTNAEDSNVEDFYYTNEEWEEAYPQGLYIVEYDSYGVYEGGEDKEEPQDVYLGVDVYRLGGNNQSDTLTYYLTGISADEELYPDSLGEIHFEPKQEKATAKIRITNDDERKGDQVVMFSLANADKGVLSPSSSALITVTDDEPYIDGEIRISVSDTVLDKSKGGAEVTVTRSKSISEYSSLTIFTADGSAKAGVDYEKVEKELMFYPGESEKVVTVPFIQSDEKFTAPKNFTVTVKDLKGCVLADEDSISVQFTNKLENEAQKLTQVDSQADLENNTGEALADSSNSVININDNFDRTSMLSAAIGSLSGENVKPFAAEGMRAASTQNWTDYLYVDQNKFQTIYNNGEPWAFDEQYNDGNQDLMIVSKESYDLNQFSDVYYSFQNHRVLLNGYPNTAVGYMVNDGTHFNSKKFSYTKGSLNSNSDLAWMKERNTYVIANYNNCNVDKVGGSFLSEDSYNTSDLANTLHSDFLYSGKRMPNTVGVEGKNQSLFFMLYDDSGWDDHHFSQQYVVLKRDVVPVEILKGEGVSDFKVSENGGEVSFVKDGYKYIFKANPKAGGITKCDKSAYGYGFYAGSELTVSFSAVSAMGQATPVPEYVFFTDNSGVVHTSAKVDGSNFTFKLETILNDDRNALCSQYYMSSEEAEAHVSILKDEAKLISSRYSGSLNLDVRYSLKQSVDLFYKDVPTLTTKATLANGNRETDSEYESRVMNVLDGVLEFYLNGEEVTPQPVINRTNHSLQYPSTDFDFIRVTPSAMGVGAVVTSNLYDVDYTRIVASTDISEEICRQNSSRLQFNVLSEETTYVHPTLGLEAVSVSTKNDDEFLTEYIANHLDRTVPFESLYFNTSPDNSDISYYTVDFSISDIYVAGATDCAKKDFVVSVYNEDTTNETEKQLLFEYIFTGGRTVSKAEDVLVYNLNSEFTKYDNIETPQGVSTEVFKPFVKLMGLSNEGFKYRMYIPTFFCYQGSNNFSSYYPTVFDGKDGVCLEISEIAEGSSEELSKIKKGSLVAAMGANDMQYVAPQLPAFDTQSAAQEGETPYSDVQQEFCTYRENCLLLGSPNLAIDCTNITMFCAKIIRASVNASDYETERKRLIRCAGSGVSIKLGSDSINIIARLSYAPDKLTKPIAAVPYAFSDGSSVTNESVRALQGSANSKYLGITVGFSGEANLQLNYDTLSHRYVFSKIMFTGSATGSFSATIPTTIPMVFFGITTSLTGSIGTGYTQVLNYVDRNGVSHYQGLSTGAPMNIAVGVSGTVGVGFAGVLAIEGGISFDTALSVTWATSKFKPVQSEVDLAKTSSDPKLYKLNYSEGWEFDYQGASQPGGKEVVGYEKYRFGETLAKTTQAGQSCVITASATGIQLTGVASKLGAVMEVTVENSDTGEILDNSYINTYSEKTKYGATLYTYNMRDYLNCSPVNMKITIEHHVNSDEGRYLILDSIRITNPKNYNDSYDVIDFTSFYFKLALAVKLTLGPFKIGFDPAYMQFNVTKKNYSVTLGTLGYSYTWNYKRQSVRTLEEGKEQDIPLLTASSTNKASLTQPDYFTLGQYGSEKEIRLLAGDIDSTANVQSVYHNGKIYSFFAAITKSETGNCSYRIYCSVDGKEAKPVTESESYINEFCVFEDNQGRLYAQLIAADSTVSHLEIKENGAVTVHYTDTTAPLALEDTDDLGVLLNSMCVKLALFDEGTGTFLKENITVIPETESNSRLESIPAVAEGSKKAGVVFYVVDKKTDVNADYNINNDSRVEGIRDDIDKTKELYDTIYSGRSELRYAVLKDGVLSESAAVNANPTEAELKAGYKITEISAIMADDDNLCLSYKAELPYSVMCGQPGTLKEVYWQNGKLENDGSITFDKRVTVASVMDFDKSIADFEASLSDEFLTEEYYNPNSYEFYSEIILGHLDMKKANIRDLDASAGDTQTEPCLFYATNRSINYVTYDKIKQALSGDKAQVGVLYDEHFEDYVVAIAENGSVNLVYAKETDKYQDSLYYISYDSSENIWTKPVRLTYSDVFDENAFKDFEPTATLNFDSFDAFVNKRGEISVSVRSSYVPFIYKYSAEPTDAYGDTSVDAFANADYEYVDENGNLVQGIVYPTLDPSSESARSDVFSLTFKNPQTKIDVDSFCVVNPVFVKDETVDVSFDIVNAGDTSVKEMNIELVYYDLDTGTTNRIKYQEFTGMLLAGDRMSVNMVYDVADYVGGNLLLGVRITDGMDTLYHSYNDSYLKAQSDESFENITYHEISNSTEFAFSAVRADIDSEGIMTFAAEVESYGTLSPENEVMLYCKAYDGEADGEYLGTVFAYSIDPSKLEVGSIASVTNKTDVSSYLVDNKLYYSFELKAQDRQYTTDNDKTSISTGNVPPEISVNSSDFADEGLRLNGNAHSDTLTFNMRLGDEISLNTDVVSACADTSLLSVYEIGSDCLSISQNPADGNIRLKAISLPEDNSGVIKAIIHLRDTSVYKYLYIRIANREFVEFKETLVDKGWSITGQNHIYAVNYTLAQTTEQGSEINFKFYGDSLEIIGDKLTNGGDFEITLTDTSGKEVEKSVVSTKAELNDFGKVLYKGKIHGFGEYSVKIRAILEKGEKLSLDRADFSIDRSKADVTPYISVNSYKETLDAPLVNGRQRQASFTLTFSKDIALAEGKKLNDLTLKFTELKGDGKTFEPTGQEVTFTASEIKDNTLVFTAPLQSTPGYVMKYVLEDEQIPSGFIVDDNKNPTDTKIPDYDLVSYILKESGILSVSVCDDSQMSQGSVKKSVQVKFMSVPDTERLEGTKLLYKTLDHKGREKTVEFNYVGITNDPRVALYRADSLTLDENELEKTFSFESGIVLNSENYVLVTAQGDYLDNDITTIYEKSDLDITYVKAKAVSTDISVSVSDSAFRPSVYITFNEAVDLQGATNNAYITLRETTCKDDVESSRDLELFAESVLKDGKTLVFRTNITVNTSQADRVQYSVISDRIKYKYNNTFVVTSNEKISVNPFIGADEISFNTNAYIESITPYSDSSETLYAKAVFASELTEESLKNTYVTLKTNTEKYSSSAESFVTLGFESCEVLVNGDKKSTIAIYKSSEPSEATLEYNEISKTFTPSDVLGIKGTLTDVRGEECTPSVLTVSSLEISRVQAKGGEITLSENGDSGYHAELSLVFDENINVESKDGVFAALVMTEGNEERQLALYLDSAQQNVLRFRTETPFTLENGVVTTFKATERFSDSLSYVTTENGIGVSERISSVNELVIDNTSKGQVISTNVTLDKVDKENVKAVVSVKYNEIIRELSFEGATLEAFVNIINSDGTVSVVKKALEFEGLEDSNTAVFSAVVGVSSDVTEIWLTPTEEIVPLGTGRLYSENRTLTLSQKLNDINRFKAKRVTSSSIVMLPLVKGDINTLSNIAIVVSYPVEVITENIEGITLKVKAQGIENTEEVIFRAHKIYGDKHLVFYAENADELTLANVVTLSTENAVLELEKGSVIAAGASGIDVNRKVADISEAFAIKSENDLMIPTTSVATNPVETTATEEATVSTETTSPKITEATTVENTEVSAQLTSSEALEDTKVEGILTGQSRQLVIAAVSVMVMSAAVVIVLILKKKREN
ncbi:MAG: hypothetical protein IJZ54_00415 [Clostridia bacterium]|nr:hypothetical protein [Clostridia bacterium]